jgi:hypothetical protein
MADHTGELVQLLIEHLRQQMPPAPREACTQQQ